VGDIGRGVAVVIEQHACQVTTGGGGEAYLGPGLNADIVGGAGVSRQIEADALADDVRLRRELEAGAIEDVDARGKRKASIRDHFYCATIDTGLQCNALTGADSGLTVVIATAMARRGQRLQWILDRAHTGHRVRLNAGAGEVAHDLDPAGRETRSGSALRQGIGIIRVDDHPAAKRHLRATRNLHRTSGGRVQGPHASVHDGGRRHGARRYRYRSFEKDPRKQRRRRPPNDHLDGILDAYSINL